MPGAGTGRCFKIIQAWLAGGDCIPESQRKLYEIYTPFIKDLANENGLDEDLMFNNVQANTVKTLLKFRKDNQNRKNAEKHIVDTLKANRSPTEKTINAALGITPISKYQRGPNAVVKKWKPPQIRLSLKPQSIASEKNRVFLSILTPGQIQLWKDYAGRYNLDNEYAALSKVTAILKDL